MSRQCEASVLAVTFVEDEQQSVGDQSTRRRTRQAEYLRFRVFKPCGQRLDWSDRLGPC